MYVHIPKLERCFQEIMLQFLMEKQGNIFKGTSDTQHLKSDWYEATCGKGILDSLQNCIWKHKSSTKRDFTLFLN